MELQQTAIHEAGHVVVAYALGPTRQRAALTHDEVEEARYYGYATSPNPVYGSRMIR